MSTAYVLARPPQLTEAEAMAVKELAKIISRNKLFYDLNLDNDVTGIRWLNTWDVQKDAGFIVPNLNYVTGDFDTEDGLDKAFALKRKLRFLSAVMHSGGGPGKAHLWIKVESEAQRLYCEAEIRKAGGDVRTQGIRPPGALHRSGQARSTSAEGFTLQQILELLRDGTRPQKPARLKLDLHQLAGESVPIGFRSERLCLIAGEALRQGLTYLDFEALILSHPEGAGEKIAKDSPRRQTKYLKDVWSYVGNDRATLPKLKPGPADAGGDFKKISLPERWTKHVLSCPHVQKSRLNLKATILEIERLSRLNHGQPFHLSQRSLADAIGSSARAAYNCIQKLREFGYLERVVSGSHTLACSYTLGKSQKWITQPLEGGKGCTERVVTFCDKCSHDSLFGRNGLKNYLLALDSSEPFTVPEIAVRTCRTRQTVYKAMKTLESWGLIAKKGKGYVRIEDEAAHVGAARLRGTLGRGERRKVIHALQRLGWELARQRRAEAKINEAKRQKLKDQAKYQHGTSQAERNRTKSEHLQVQNRIAGRDVSVSLRV